MNRIEKLFKTKSKNILSIYFTSGYPELNSTVSVITELFPILLPTDLLFSEAVRKLLKTECHSIYFLNN
jgi:hypothetical protein